MLDVCILVLANPNRLLLITSEPSSGVQTCLCTEGEGGGQPALYLHLPTLMCLLVTCTRCLIGLPPSCDVQICFCTEGEGSGQPAVQHHQGVPEKDAAHGGLRL
jgi:hypothetical protein